ncbi:MAG: T9SS type A sorting domain-containing protein [candidate division WOR-3 bacterium]
MYKKIKNVVLVVSIFFLNFPVHAKEEAKPELYVLTPNIMDYKIPAPTIDTNRIWQGATANLTREVTVGKNFKGSSDDTIRVITVQSGGSRYLVIATDTSKTGFGKGKFRIVTPYQFPSGGSAYSVAVGNIDGDEYTDIIVGLAASPYTVYWFEWDALASSWVLVNSFNASAAVYDIVIGDADNDGIANEIVLAVSSTTTPHVLRVIWTGSSWDITTIPLSGAPSRGVAIGDVRPDLLGNEIYVVGSSYIWMIYWNGSSWQVSTIIATAAASWDVVVGDIDLSLPGNEFAVVHSSTSYQVSVWNWTGSTWSGRAWAWTSTWGTSDNDIAIGDVITDNYGKELIITGGSATSAVPVIFWIGSGGSGWVRTLPKTKSTFADYGVAVGDVNRHRSYNQEFVLSGGGSLVEGEQIVYSDDIGTYWIRMKNYTAVVNQPDTIIVGIFNAGSSSQSNFYINYNFKTNPLTGSYLYTGTLPPFGTDIVKIPVTINFLGMDTLYVKTNLAGDQNTLNDRTSLHLEVYNDSTRCASGFNATLFPPSNSTVPPTSWQRVIISGSYNWERFTSPSNPAAPVFEGYAVAGYRSYYASSGSKARLITHPFNVGSTPKKIKLRFYMYHDPGYSTSPDSIIIEYSYDAVTFQRVAGFARYSPTASWVRHDVEIGDFPANKTLYVSFLAKSGYGNNMFIDSVRIFATAPTAPVNDAGITYVFPPSKPFIYGSSMSVKAILKNFGLAPLTNTLLFYTTGGTDTVWENWTGYLELNGIDTFTFSVPFVPQDTGIITLYVGTKLQGDQNSSNDVSSITFRVCPLYHIPPYSKNFDENWLNSSEPPFCGWVIVDGGSESPQVINNNDWHRYVSTNPPRTVARIYFSPVEWSDDWLISPRFNCSQYGTYTLSFWHYYNDYSTSSSDSGRVLLSTDGGNTWIKIAMYSNQDDSGTKYFDITPYVNGKDNVKIAFHYVAYNEWWWYIDNFSINFVPDNEGPTISLIQIPQNAYHGPFTVKAIIKDISGIANDSLYYIVDDIVYQIGHISVSGDTFTFQIPDQSPGKLVDFYLKAKDYANNTAITQTYSFYVLYPLPSSNLIAYGIPGQNDVKLRWNAPYEEIYYYGQPTYAWGAADGSMIATRFTPQYYPCKIEAIAMMFYLFPDTAELIVWQDDGYGNPGNVIYSDTVIITNLYPNFEIFDLSSRNIVINSGDFHVGIKWLGVNTPFIVSDDTSRTTRNKYNAGSGWFIFPYDFVISSFVSYSPQILSSVKRIKEKNIKVEEELFSDNEKKIILNSQLRKYLIQGRETFKKPNLYYQLLGIGNFEILRSLTPGGPYTSIGTTTQTFFTDPNVNTNTTYYYVVKTNYVNPDTFSEYSNEAKINVDFEGPLYQNTSFDIMNNTLYISSDITDWTGLLYDSLGYRFDGSSFNFITHDSVKNAKYYYSIPVSQGVNLVEFYLFSRDSSWWKNPGRDPDTGYYQFTGILEKVREIPKKFFFNVLNSLSKDNYVKFVYGIPTKTEVEISVYNITGRKVKTLLKEEKEPGVYYVLWNAVDEKGRKIGQGTYFVKIKTKEKEEIRKFIIVK